MSRSVRIRAHDIRRCHALVSTCRDKGADTWAWQDHLVGELRRLLRAQVGIAGNMRNFGKGHEAEALGSVRQGWMSAEAERHWLTYALNVPVEQTPEYPALAAATRGALVTRTRNQLWGREAWYRSRAFNERHRPCGVDDYIISIQKLPNDGLWHSLWLHRATGEPEFDRREWWILRFVHAEIGRLVGGPLASAAEPQVADLTPRQRDALDGVLQGDSEKELAARLGLSRATAHEHVLAVYRHFGVETRAELMARFIGRGRPPRDGKNGAN